MKSRPTRPVFDLSTWPEYDPKVLTEDEREIFNARRLAVELYAENFAIKEIERQTGVNRKQLYRVIAACTHLHDDGHVYGYRAIRPYVRTGSYQRKMPTKSGPRDSVYGGSAGAFRYLLQCYPALEDWLLAMVHDKSIRREQGPGEQLRLVGLTKLHGDFLQQCRAQGISELDYPLNTAHKGKRALSVWVKGRIR